MPRRQKSVSEEIVEKFLQLPDVERALLLRYLTATQRGLATKDALSRGVSLRRPRKPVPVPAGA